MTSLDQLDLGLLTIKIKGECGQGGQNITVTMQTIFVARDVRLFRERDELGLHVVVSDQQSQVDLN